MEYQHFTPEEFQALKESGFFGDIEDNAETFQKIDQDVSLIKMNNLSPLILYGPVEGSIIVTSKEAASGKFH